MQNRQILTANKDKAFRYKDYLDGAIARADTAAYLEARRKAIWLDTEQPAPPTLPDLEKTFGRPTSTTALGRLRDAAFAAAVTSNSHPWFADTQRPGAPSILELPTPKATEAAAGHLVFTVTAKDILFAFYRMGLVGQKQLQKNLEALAREDEHLARKRREHRMEAVFNLPRPPPLELSAPEAERLKRLQQAAAVPQQLLLRRLEHLRAFERRHGQRQQRRATLSNRQAVRR